MIKNIKILTPIFVIFFSITTASSQSWSKHGKVTHEVGFYLGSAHFATDYGDREDFQSNVGGNIGIAVGALYYITFADYRYRWNQRTNYFRDHFRIRNELSYYSAKLEHYGQYVAASETSDGADKLRAMSGETYTISLGSQLEFHFKDITEFGSRRNPHLKFSPYLSFGIHAEYYNPTLTTTYGDGDWENNPNLLYDKWAVPGAVDTSSGITASLSGGFGSRYKVSEFGDMFLGVNWKYYFTDWVEGLNATELTFFNPTKSNYFNDWSMSIQIGYIVYLN